MAVFHAATAEEIRAAHPGFLLPTDPAASAFKDKADDPRWDEELAQSLRAGEPAESRLARLEIEDIAGQEVSVLPSEAGVPIETPLPVFLIGPKETPVYELPAAVKARLAHATDPVAFGKAWAAALLAHSRVPPKLTPEEEEQVREEVKKTLGRDPLPEEMKWVPPDPDAFRESAWVAVACELTQLAQFAERTGKQIYLEWYED